MIPFVDDPTQTLKPMGGAWVGIVIPSIILGISILVSFWLYWYFVHKKNHDKA